MHNSPVQPISSESSPTGERVVGPQGPEIGRGGPSSRGNLNAAFTAGETGKTAYYALRWVSTRGEKGPWSEVAAATVAA